jgi:2-polyprenyl-3-methyl-5-hydroxy-6-metoxy-1,4-benzoquinol methylase
LLETLQIDVLAVGENYGKDFPEQAEVLDYCFKNGIGVHKTPYFKNISSTRIKNNIRTKQFWNNLPIKKNPSATMLTSFNSDDKLISKETEKEVELFSKYISSDSRILDLGCGNGRLTIPLSKICKEITAVDFSEKLLESIKGDNIKTVLEDATKYYDGTKYDIIICSGLFPTLDDSQFLEVISNIKFSLNKDGYLLVRNSCADKERINVINQFSDKLKSLYTAFYRTPLEIVEKLDMVILENYFLYRNHPDTHVRFFAFKLKR